MRLSSNGLSNLKDSINIFDRDEKLLLSSSRVDDSQKGGDIELLIVSKVIRKNYLRNTIVHKYIEENLLDIFNDVIEYSKNLMSIIKSTVKYIKAYNLDRMNLLFS